MVDNVAITAGTGTTVAADDIGGGVLAQRVKPVWGPDGTGNDTDVASGKALPVQVRSATGLIPIGEPTDAANTATDTTSVTHTSIFKQISASVQIVAGAIAAAVMSVKAAASAFADGSIVTLGAKADAKSTATDTTSITAMSVWKQISASVQSLVTGITTLGAAAMAASLPVTIATDDARIGPVTETAPASDTASSGLNGRLQRIAQRVTSLIALIPAALGQTVKASSLAVAVASDQTWPTGMSPRAFSAAFSTLTRPANTTAYTALDSISDNATAGSVTALSATVGDVNDDPLTVTEILITSTDTGLAGKRIRAYLFNSDPTASSGVVGGDNAAFSQKKAGYIGSMSGVLETGFSDGTVGRLVPSYADGAAASTPNAAAGGFVVTKPTAGAKTLYIQYQAVDGFTPSANSTTIIGTARGFQGRAS